MTGAPEPQIPTMNGWSLSVYSLDPDFNPPDLHSVKQQQVKEKSCKALRIQNWVAEDQRSTVHVLIHVRVTILVGGL